jgi:SAM-dependent methyltransferase
MTTTPTTPTPETVTRAVQEHYGAIAREGTSCCGPTCCTPAETRERRSSEPDSRALGYDAADLATLPEGADLGLGCGAPLAFLALQPGETVVDLGSGAGIDALLAARAVGPTGQVIGVDMTPDMLARARRLAAEAQAWNVEFRAGRLEALPVVDATVDAVTSNCVINLVVDKPAVFREIARVLRPGGRLVVSDIVLARPLPQAVAGDLLAWAGCVAGASERDVYFAQLAEAGLRDVEVLRDVDYLAVLDTVPPEAQAILDRGGVTLDDLRGAVRSVTYRARR